MHKRVAKIQQDAVLSLKDVRKNSDASTPLGNMDFEGEAG